jgi:hypothetical protein
MKNRNGVGIPWNEKNSPQFEEIIRSHFIANSLDEFRSRKRSLVKTLQLSVDGIECYGTILFWRD